MSQKDERSGEKQGVLKKGHHQLKFGEGRPAEQENKGELIQGDLIDYIARIYEYP